MFIGTMTRTNDNRKTFDTGMRKAKQIAFNHVHMLLIMTCDDLIADAIENKEYGNLTGNTVTSYACGLYSDGSLSYVSMSADKMKKPIRVKVTKGKWVRLNPDYDGRTRSFKGSVETDEGYGYDTSMKFLKSYKPKSNKGIDLVMCTGTEYSSYLESELGLNVLTETFQGIRKVLQSNFKPMT